MGGAYFVGMESFDRVQEDTDSGREVLPDLPAV